MHGDVSLMRSNSPSIFASRSNDHERWIKLDAFQSSDNYERAPLNQIACRASSRVTPSILDATKFEISMIGRRRTCYGANGYPATAPPEYCLP
jgi:hypothetical protein